ncbi:MAG: CRISPR-associated protein Cas4 [Candidatus Thermoplasmatota archaeon]|nr:CRISPR-associated protein Cas4 [Candidatus Thermoplasmatota archaeon]
MHITGKEISYLYICKRKLWFFRHGLRPELENDNVRIGMHLNETAFRREEKDIPIGEAGVIDWAAFKHGIIHETKKGRSPGKGDEAQVRYYLWWLNDNGIRVSEAQIHYPKMKKTNVVKWTEAAKIQAELDVAACRKIIEEPKPPEVCKYPYCKSCAYMELCYS